eukprot:3378979-Rhodomonas_salina.1
MQEFMKLHECMAASTRPFTVSLSAYSQGQTYASVPDLGDNSGEQAGMQAAMSFLQAPQFDSTGGPLAAVDNSGNV